MKEEKNRILKLISEPNAFVSGNAYQLIIDILQIYNCRISEILEAKRINFIPGRFLILEGKKRSANIIIRTPEILKRLEELPKTDEVFFFKYVSYYSIYNFIKRNYSHLFKNIKIKKTHKITHAFRYLNVDDIANDKFIKDILHHNSVKSGKYYKLKIRKPLNGNT